MTIGNEREISLDDILDALESEELKIFLEDYIEDFENEVRELKQVLIGIRCTINETTLEDF